MTSHLSVSYVTTPTATAPAAATPAAAPADNPLGLLGALFDQLLAGAVTNQPTDEATATPTITAPVPIGTAVPLGTPQSTPPGLALLDQLTSQLADLQARIDSGERPNPNDLQAISGRIDALAALLGGPAPAYAGNVPAATSALVNISATGAPSGPGAIAGRLAELLRTSVEPQVATAAKATALPPDQAAALLASLGLSPDAAADEALATTTSALTSRPTGTVVAPVTTSTTTTAETTAAGPVAALGQKLADLSVALTAVTPIIARKLDALAARVTAVQDASDLLARLDPATAGSTASSTASLDAIVARLDTVRATGPQLGAPALSPPDALSTAIASAIGGRRDAALSAVPGATTTTAALPVDVSLALSPVQPLSAATPKDLTARLQPRDPIVADQPEAARTETSTAGQPAAVTPGPAPVANATPRYLPAAYQPVSSPINMGHVAFEMVRQAHQGLSRFAIRLDPAELGRIDVRMHVDAAGAVTAKLTVDRPETLDLFQRDQRTLERALQQAGLDSSRTTLEFSLRQNQNPFAGMSGSDQRQPGDPGSRVASTSDDDAAPLASIITLYRGTASAGGVNLFV